VGQYEILETLGKGGYSWVKKGYDSKQGTTVALKFMARAEKSWENEQADQVKTEIRSMIKIKSENVMKMFAYNLNCKYPEKSGGTIDTILLVLEYCPGGELFDILFYTNQLDEKTARTYFLQLMEGLQACHSAGIVHRDLKPQNLLMDARYQLKITDFGLSKLVKDANKAVMKTHYVGTRGYQAPELLRRKKYTKACDIFSAGVVLFILLTGYPPFEQAVKTDKWYKPLTQKNFEKFWKQHDGCGVKSDAQKLITQMLAYHSSDRIDIDGILATEFCQGKTHTPDELYHVLKKKHRAASKRRKKDKNKMREMQNSATKRDLEKMFPEIAKRLSTVPCPERKYEARQTLMTKRWIVRPSSGMVKFEGDAQKCKDAARSEGNNQKSENVASPVGESLNSGKPLKSEGKEKEETQERYPIPEDLVHAYIIALEALKFKGQTKLDTEGNPWDVNCKATTMNESEFKVNMKIHRDENGVYYFNFRRETGNPLEFHKFWKNCEQYFIHSKFFTDELDEEAEEEEAAANEDDEKLQNVLDDGKQED